MGKEDLKILKFFTLSSVDAITNALKDVSLEDLLAGMYFKTKDNDINYMAREYEKMLVLCKANHDRFEKELHDFYIKMAKYIKEEKKYFKFFKLLHETYIRFYKKNIDENILRGFQNMIVQQFPYISGSTKKVLYGMDEKNKLLYVSEIVKNLTEINYSIKNYINPSKYKTIDSVDDYLEQVYLKNFRKYGYKNVKSLNDCLVYINDDSILTNNLYQLSYFMCYNSKFLMALPFRRPQDAVNAHLIFMYNRKDKMEIIEEKLIHRSIMLPPEGIIIKFVNNGDIKEIILLENIIDDSVILLFKIKFEDGTYTTGYYDTINKIFYNMWKDSNREEDTHDVIQNIILQNYLNLTCSLTTEEKDGLLLFNEIKDLNLKEYNKLIPYVYYEIKEEFKDSKGKITYESRHFDRSKYIAEIMDIKPFIRRLPMNATASIEAMELAKKLGIELMPNQTLVRGFQKKVYKSGT